jgi:hypothetical protein
MAQTLLLKNSGLQTNSNQLSAVSEGALNLANNISIDKDEVAESRRGFKRLSDTIANNDARFDRITGYQGAIIARRKDNDTMNYWQSGIGWTAYSGTYEHPDVDLARMQFLQQSGNLYFTTSLGVKVLDNYAGPIYNTGMPKGLDGVGSTTGTSGFMAHNTQRAYRIVWGTKDANNNLYLGAPSQRIIVANTVGGTGTSRDVSLTFTIPAGITVNDFFQVYRSKGSATSSDEPNDELQLVYEENPTSGQITAKSVTFTDSTPDSLMGAFLYTNASQEGLQESNEEPPLSKDIALFKGYVFFANVQSKFRLNIKLLAVGGTAGLALDDTIIVDGITYTAKATENIASNQFKLTTTGSAAQNIADTTLSFIKVVNQSSSNTSVYAYYESGYQDLPGQILISTRSIDTNDFTVSVNRATAWDIGTGQSTNDNYQNGLMWSKDGQPESVPLSHIEFVGSKNYPIRRIVALKDSLFILKADGVFRLTGGGGQWNIDPLDTSTRIIAPDSAAVVNNQIFCLADQGIVNISDIGVQVISRPIENQILGLISEDFSKLKKLSYGIAYETDRKYILNTITLAADDYTTQSFVYNTFTQAWTKWIKNSYHGFNNTDDDKLYLCDTTTKHILQERKSLDYTDYADEELDGFSIVSYSGSQIVLNTVVGLENGYLLYKDSSNYAVISSINASTNTITVNNNISWSIGSITVLKHIECEIEYVNQHMKNPGVMKLFQEVAMLYRETNFITGVISFYTDLSGGYSNTSFSGNYGGNAWGSFSWGTPAWGSLQRPKPIRSFIPREKSRGTVLSCKIRMAEAFSKWSINGLSLQYDWVSERVSRF